MPKIAVLGRWNKIGAESPIDYDTLEAPNAAALEEPPGRSSTVLLGVGENGASSTNEAPSPQVQTGVPLGGRPGVSRRLSRLRGNREKRSPAVTTVVSGCYRRAFLGLKGWCSTK